MIRKLGLMLVSGVICLLGVTSGLAQEEYNTPKEYEKETGEKIEKYFEAPMLKIKVATGELLPVEERIPEEPMVVEPFEEIGKYGGTLQLSQASAVKYSPACFWTSYEYLLSIGQDEKGHDKMIPCVAKGWKFSNDGKILTLYLRKGMKWSDGVPFTVDDIVFGVEDMLFNDKVYPTKPKGWMSGGEPMKVKKIDDYTIEFHFAEPEWGAAIKFYTGQGYFFLPKHALKKYHIKYNKEADELAKKEGYDHWYQLFNAKRQAGVRGQYLDIPTLGPWVVKKILLDGLIFERNPYYWKVDTAGNQLPYIDKVRSIICNTPEMRLMKILAGQIDFESLDLSTADYPVLMESAKEGGYRAWVTPSFLGAETAYFFNQNYTEDQVLGDLLRDVRFRQALSLAINREEINEIVGLGHGVPRQATVLPSSSFYEDWWAKYYAEYDPEKANETLDKMGLDKRDKDGYRLRPDGKRLTIIVTLATAMASWTPTSELVKEYWEKVGVKTILNVAAGGYFWTFTGSGKSQVHVWCADSQTEIGFILKMAVYDKGGLNWAPEWLAWWNSKGKTGEEPPEEIKKIWSLCEKLLCLPEKERNQAAKEILSFRAKNLFFIGTVGMIGTPCIANSNLGNVNPEIRGVTSEYLISGRARLEQYFWKK